MSALPHPTGEDLQNISLGELDAFDLHSLDFPHQLILAGLEQDILITDLDVETYQLSTNVSVTKYEESEDFQSALLCSAAGLTYRIRKILQDNFASFDSSYSDPDPEAKFVMDRLNIRYILAALQEYIKANSRPREKSSYKTHKESTDGDVWTEVHSGNSQRTRFVEMFMKDQYMLDEVIDQENLEVQAGFAAIHMRDLIKKYSANKLMITEEEQGTKTLGRRSLNKGSVLYDNNPHSEDIMWILFNALALEDKK